MVGAVEGGELVELVKLVDVGLRLEIESVFIVRSGYRSDIIRSSPWQICLQ